MLCDNTSRMYTLSKSDFIQRSQWATPRHRRKKHFKVFSKNLETNYDYGKTIVFLIKPPFALQRSDIKNGDFQQQSTWAAVDKQYHVIWMVEITAWSYYIWLNAIQVEYYSIVN